MGRYHATTMTEPLSPPAPGTAADPAPTSPETLAQAARTRRLAVFATLGLIALGLAWELWLAPLRPGGSWWALKVLPLTLPLPGLLKNRMYTYRWLSLAVWLYVTEALVRATSDRGLGAWLAVGQLLLCVLLFVACTLHIRGRLRDAKAAGQTEPPSPAP
jgi:uncharacterized membrane protein